ncbi:MAG: hypothetical protein ABI461_03005 [Polyangiaceae bacterium]
MNPNPYAAPKTGSAPSGEAPDKTHFTHDEQADLFVATLAPILLKANAFTLVLGSAFMVLFALRLILAVSQDPLAIALEIGQLLIGVGGFVIARQVLRGSTAAWIAGLVASPLSALCSLFALATGSVGGLFCGGLSVANLVLLAVNWNSIKRIGEARKILRQAGIDG